MRRSHAINRDADTRALRSLVGGGSLESRRSFPFPHRYYLVIKDLDGTKLDESEVGEASVRTLVHRGWVTPKPQDSAWDHVIYELTAAGRAVIEKETGANKS